MDGGERKLWELDAIGGGSKSPMDVLLDWISEHGNYEWWRSDVNQINTKESICQEIFALMHQHGLTHRHTRDVRSKINDLERTFCDVVNWRSGTGEGIMAARGAEGAPDIRVKMNKFCKHYDVLEPVMLDSASSRPLFTNEESVASTESHGDDSSNEHAEAEQASTIPAASEESPPTFSPSVRASPIVQRRKRKFDVVELWKDMSAANTAIERERLRLEERKLALKELRAQAEADKMLASLASFESRLQSSKDLHDKL